MSSTSLDAMSAADATATIGRSLLAIDVGVRPGLLAEKLALLSNLHAVRVLGCALRSSVRQDLEARAVVDTLSRAMLSGAVSPAFVFAWRLAATELGDEDVVRALAAADDNAAAPGVLGRADAKGETLGRRRARGRVAMGIELDRLILDSDPVVIERVLQNPRMTEVRVVRLSARRRLAPALIPVILASKYGNAAAVRRAIVMNPATEAPTAVRLLAALPIQDLRAIAEDPSVGDVVRTAAQHLLPARP